MDNSTGLITITAKVNNTVKQTLSYGGFNTTPSNSGDTNWFENPTSSDPYNNNNLKKGFRLNGTMQLKDVGTSSDHIGAPSNTKYVLEYKYVRHSDVSANTITKTYDIYIDQLSDPSISNKGQSASVSSVKYTMGIPSVHQFNITLTRTYKNINSTHKFIPGNGIIADITSISKTNQGSTKTVVLNRNNIVTGGQYILTRQELPIIYHILMFIIQVI